MTALTLAYAATLSLFLTFGLVFPVRSLLLRAGSMDKPNARSSHRVATPRGGGLAIVLAGAVTVVVFLPAFFPAGFGGVFFAASAISIVAAVSAWDDLRSLSFKFRLAVQATAAAIVVWGLEAHFTEIEFAHWSHSLPYWFGFCLAVLFLVGFSNFFNFMDGINGLAAGHAGLSAAALAVLLYHAGLAVPACCAAAISGGCLGFLPHNFPRARIFLGDVGSVTLGFSLAVLIAVGHTQGGISLTALLLPQSVFLFDPLMTLAKRFARGENIVEPHREHNYQLLIRRGWSHGRTTVAFWSITAVCCAAALAYAKSPAAMQRLCVFAPLVLLSTGAGAIHRTLPPPPVASSAESKNV